VRTSDKVVLKKLKKIPKEESMDELICYCFQYTVDDIKNDYKKNGKSLIL
jgi:hypothetical protein